MKRILTGFGIFAGALLALDFLCGVCVQTVISRSGFRFARLYGDRRMAADVVVLGNSRAVNSFYVPELEKRTGLRWLNLGYNGIGPRLVEALLLDYLDRHEKPRLVVLEMSNAWQGTGPIRDLRIFARRSPRLRALDAGNGEWLDDLLKMSALNSVNGEMILRVAYYLGKDDQNWVNSGRLDPNQADEAQRRLAECLSPEVSEEAVSAYRRIFRELKERGIDMCCFIGPYFANEPERKTVRTAVAKVMVPDVPFIDSIDAVDDVSSYADPQHLNREGAVRYAGILLPGLCKFFPGLVRTVPRGSL